LTVLIIGLGSIARKHIAAIRKLEPGAHIFALRSGRTASVEENVSDIYSLDELQEAPDFVIISNPTHFHAESIEASLALGKPLLIEKPLFGSLVNNQKILDKLAEKNISTYIACNLRFHPVILFLKEHLLKNKSIINEVNIYCGSHLPDWRPGTDYKKGYSTNADLGGGAHLDLIHELDYAYWLFGHPSKTVSVRRNVSSINIKAVDFAAYHLFYPGYTTNVTLNYYRKTPKRILEIVFDNDVYLCDLLACNITNSNREIIFTDPDFQMADTYLAQMQYFMLLLKNNKRSMNTAADAFEVLKIALHDETA